MVVFVMPFVLKETIGLLENNAKGFVYINNFNTIFLYFMNICRRSFSATS